MKNFLLICIICVLWLYTVLGYQSSNFDPCDEWIRNHRVLSDIILSTAQWTEIGGHNAFYGGVSLIVLDIEEPNQRFT